VGELGPSQSRHTVAKLLDQAEAAVPAVAPVAAIGPTVAECDAKLARYRAALEAGADPAVVAGWIAETQAERRRSEQRERAVAKARVPDTVGRVTENEIIGILEELGDLVTALRDAEPEHKLEVYRSLGLRLTYDPETQTVRADVDLAAHRWIRFVSEGGLEPPRPIRALAPQASASAIPPPGPARRRYRSAAERSPSSSCPAGRTGHYCTPADPIMHKRPVGRAGARPAGRAA
jgi:hypothetical protein